MKLKSCIQTLMVGKFRTKLNWNFCNPNIYLIKQGIHFITRVLKLKLDTYCYQSVLLDTHRETVILKIAKNLAFLK